QVDFIFVGNLYFDLSGIGFYKIKSNALANNNPANQNRIEPLDDLESICNIKIFRIKKAGLKTNIRSVLRIGEDAMG
ncbi:MAG: hypothetical protein V3R96_07290, partial [Dehalococcoidales bacterium]